MRRAHWSGTSASVLLLSWSMAAQVVDERLPGNVVDVAAHDFYFTAPDSIPPGLTTFRLDQAGIGHELRIVEIEAGHSFEEFAVATKEGRQTPWTRMLGGPGFTDPPKRTNATLHLRRGTYALVCDMPMPGEGHSHRKSGMMKRLDVVGEPVNDGIEPAADLVVRILKEGFDFSPVLSAGRHVVRVENAASDMRQFRIQRVLPGSTVEDARTWERGRSANGRVIDGADGSSPPFDARGRLSGIPPGQHLLTTIDLPAGTYLVSSLPGRMSSEVFEVR